MQYPADFIFLSLFKMAHAEASLYCTLHTLITSDIHVVDIVTRILFNNKVSVLLTFSSSNFRQMFPHTYSFQKQISYSDLLHNIYSSCIPITNIFHIWIICPYMMYILLSSVYPFSAYCLPLNPKHEKSFSVLCTSSIILLIIYPRMTGKSRQCYSLSHKYAHFLSALCFSAFQTSIFSWSSTTTHKWI